MVSAERPCTRAAKNARGWKFWIGFDTFMHFRKSAKTIEKNVPARLVCHLFYPACDRDPSFELFFVQRYGILAEKYFPVEWNDEDVSYVRLGRYRDQQMKSGLQPGNEFGLVLDEAFTGVVHVIDK